MKVSSILVISVITRLLHIVILEHTISQARLCVLHWIDLHLLSCREFGASHWSEGAKDRGGVMAEPSGIESQG